MKLSGLNPSGDPCICGEPSFWHPECYHDEALAMTRLIERLRTFKRMPTKYEQKYFLTVFGRKAVDRLIAAAGAVP